MSENIQSISQGTYTIGQTSATNFVAGNGIKIDEPSAGTVRIGNDETVLYYSPTNHNVATDAEFVLSESIWNFERVMITFDNMEYVNRYVTMIIDLSGLSHDNNQLATPWCNGGVPKEVNIPWAIFKINTSGNIKYINRGLIYGTWTQPGYTTGDLRGLRVVHVVGINRISGSNA